LRGTAGDEGEVVGDDPYGHTIPLDARPADTRGLVVNAETASAVWQHVMSATASHSALRG
jgi:hypothetical protein